MIRDVMISDNISIDIDYNIEDTLSLMIENTHAVVVVLSDDIVIGVISEKDIISLSNQKSSLNFDSSIRDSFEFTSVVKINHNRSIEEGLDLLLDNNLRRLIVTDDNNTLVGIVTQDILIKNLDSYGLNQNILISEFIDADSTLVTLDHRKTIFDTISIMHTSNITSIIITNKYGENVGIVSEKDILFNMYYKNNTDRAISTIMSSPIISVGHTEKTNEILDMMGVKNIRRVLITDDNDKPLSLVTTRDLANSLRSRHTHILNKKIKHINSTLNYMGESVIELTKDGDKYVIRWMNKIARQSFGDLMRSDIDKLIQKDILENMFKNLSYTNQFNNIKIEVMNKDYEVVSSCYMLNNERILLMIFKDITIFETKIKDLQAKNRANQDFIIQQSQFSQMGNAMGLLVNVISSIKNKFKENNIEQFININTKQEGSYLILELSCSGDKLSDNIISDILNINKTILKKYHNTLLSVENNNGALFRISLKLNNKDIL